jgi:hypothetical protein
MMAKTAYWLQQIDADASDSGAATDHVVQVQVNAIP